jgi:hypothetical protein
MKARLVGPAGTKRRPPHVTLSRQKDNSRETFGEKKRPDTVVLGCRVIMVYDWCGFTPSMDDDVVLLI